MRATRLHQPRRRFIRRLYNLTALLCGLCGVVALTSGPTRAPTPPRKQGVQQTVNIIPRPHWTITWASGRTRWHVHNIAWPYNDELEAYVPRAVHWTAHGGFIIRIGPYPAKGRHYTSGRLTTRGVYTFEYGRVNVVAEIPTGPGLVPAIWLRPATNQVYPEIDILENLGSDPTTVFEVFHVTPTLKWGMATHSRDFASGFHQYTLIWTPTALTWQIDGQTVYTTTQNVPHQPMFLVINCAVGGQWPGQPHNDVWPQEFIVKRATIAQWAS